MTTEVLGSYVFAETPTVAGVPVLLTNDPNIGSIINVYTGTTPAMSVTSPNNGYSANTVPVVTAGVELWNTTVTPTSASSRFRIAQSFTLDNSTTGRIALVCIFRGSTCLCTNSSYLSSAGRPCSAFVSAIDAPASSTAITYSVRIITNGTGTQYINQASNATYGGSGASDWNIMELKQ